VIVGVIHYDDGGEESGDEDEGVGVEFQHEEATENEPIFRCGNHLWSNLLDMEGEEPLFVMELAT
jgi:hypothetical protein